MEKKIYLDTPIGKLCAITNVADEWSEIYVYIERPDGVEIDLVAAEVDTDEKIVSAYLYGDTATEQWTQKHTWSAADINIDCE